MQVVPFQSRSRMESLNNHQHVIGGVHGNCRLKTRPAALNANGLRDYCGLDVESAVGNIYSLLCSGDMQFFISQVHWFGLLKIERRA